MQLRGRRLKFTAVAALVVLSLTGFSSGRGHGGSGDGGGGGGGGCSSSSQDHGSSSSTSGGGTYHDDDDYDDYDDTGTSSGSSSGNTSGSTSTSVRDARVELVSCVTEADPYATVEVTNPNSTGHSFTVTVRFLDAGSEQVDVRSVDEFVAANDAATVRVPLGRPGLASQVDRCDPDLYAPAE
ncbi:hypothetical protein ACWD0J_00425 [Streptomyces sp. NPDC003011]